jgi:hypothetical protein
MGAASVAEAGKARAAAAAGPNRAASLGVLKTKGHVQKITSKITLD